MARAIWKGSISFGLVNIPVQLQPGEDRAEQLHFTMLDKRDMSPVGYQRINKKSGAEVPWNEIVKGYEIREGEYVIIEDDDFKKANPIASQTVEIVDFVDVDAIEPAFFDKPYYLEPGKKGEKGYVLLRETLTRTGKAGIAKVVIRTRQHLAAVIARGNALVLEVLRFGHELRDPSTLVLPDTTKAGISTRELEMAERLVEGMVAEWEPAKYRDDYTEDLLALIERKSKKGDIEEVDVPEREGPLGDVVDFTALLKRSLEARGDEGKASGKAGSRKSSAVKLATARKKKSVAAPRKPARRKSA